VHPLKQPQKYKTTQRAAFLFFNLTLCIMCTPTTRRLLRLGYALVALTALATLPAAVRAARAAHWTLRAQACLTAGVFVGLALPASFYEVAMQLAFYARPRLQIRVIRILWMVPVYALNSWFALRFAVRDAGERRRNSAAEHTH
jgi:hypothetical protein